MGSPVPHRGLRIDIQALRGWAVLVVVLYHAKLGGFASGFLGVDLFFVISGYLITRLVATAVTDGTFSFRDFYSRRAKRILPAAYTVCAITAAFAPWLLLPEELEDFGEQLVGAVTFAGNIVLWLQSGYFAGEAATKPLLHMWSLALEEQYYLLLPAALVLAPRNWWRAGVLLVAGLSLALCIYVVQREPSAAFFLLPTRAWELAAGSAAALLLNKNHDFLKLTYWPAVVTLACLPFLPNVVHPSWAAVTICIATVCVIAAHRVPGYVGAGLAKVGDVSYSLYLVHWPLFSFARAIYIGEPPVTVRAVLVLASFTLSLLLYRFIERPVWKSNATLDSRSLTAVVIASLALVTVGAVATASPGNNRGAPANYGLSQSCAQRGPGLDLTHCRSSDTPTVAVWGDSFAMALVPALGDTELVQLTKFRCGPIAGVSPFDRRAYPALSARECLQFNESAISYILDRPHIDTVVLTSAFVQYLSGDVLTHEGRVDASVDIAESGLQQVAERLATTGKRVIIVSPPPGLDGFDTAKCHRRHVLGMLSLGGGDCSIDATRFRRERAQLLELMDRLEASGLTVVRLDKLLCNQTKCRTEIDGSPIYRDAGHLSFSGAQELGKRIALSNRIK